MIAAMDHEIETRRFECPVPGDKAMAVFAAWPKGAGKHPALLVLQEAFGVNEHIREVCRRLAREGYAAFAPDLYHRFSPGHEGSYTDVEPSLQLMRKMTLEGLQADLRAAHAAILAAPEVDPERVSAIGFCMGGRAAFVAAATVPLRAAVSYYGGRIPELLELAPKVSCPLLLHWGGQDKGIPPEQIAQVTAALRQNGKDFASAEWSFAGHGFNCDVRASYQPKAAAQAWALTLRFLADPGPR